MGLVKLKTSNFHNYEESFSQGVRKTKDQGVRPDINEKGKKKKGKKKKGKNYANDEVNNSANDANDELNNSAHVSIMWYVNNINIPIIVFAITSLYYMLTIVPGTQADELYHRFSGQYEELLSKKLNKISNDNQNLNVKTKIEHIRIIGNRDIETIRKNNSDDSKSENEIQLIRREMDKKIDKLNEENIPIFNDILNYREKLKNIERIENNKLTEEHKIYIKYERYKGMKKRLSDFDSIKDICNTIFNPLAYISRKVVAPPSEYDVMANKIIHRIIEKNGLMNNIVFEFLDWYNEGPIFYTLMWLCTVAMFIPIYIRNAQIFQSLILGIVQTVTKVPSRIKFIKIMFLLSVIIMGLAWAFIMPLLIIMSFMSVYMLWFWAIPIIIFHYKDLLCEVERGGYKRKPLLLPTSKTLCKGFNILMIGPLKKLKVKCDVDEKILRKICNAVEFIPKILWLYFITPWLLFLQIFFLYLALIFKIISIVNVVSFSYYMAKKAKDGGPVFTIQQGPDIGGVWWDESKISLRMPWMKSATNKWWLPIKNYIPSPEKWSNGLMEAVDWITCIDPNIWLVNDNLISKPIEIVSEFLGIEDLIKMKHPKRCKPPWKWIKPVTFERQKKGWKPAKNERKKNKKDKRKKRKRKKVKKKMKKAKKKMKKQAKRGKGKKKNKKTRRSKSRRSSRRRRKVRFVNNYLN